MHFTMENEMQYSTSGKCVSCKHGIEQSSNVFNWKLWIHQIVSTTVCWFVDSSLECKQQKRTPRLHSQTAKKRHQQNSRGRRRRQNKEKNYTRQKAQIKPTFVPSCSQMRLQMLHFHASLRSGGDAGVNGISVKIETCRVNKVKTYLVKDENYEEIFFLPPDVAVLVCLRSLYN